ncbi:MAG: hypothetical protein WD768_20965 [Phycisphaeraceae bacterium]
MSRHSIVYTLGACALAGAVLAATIALSPKVGAPPAPPTLKRDPDGKFAPPDFENPGKLNGPIKPGGVIDRYHIRRYNKEKNQLTIMTGDRFIPKPNGVADVDNPTAYIHLIPGRRVLKVSAKEGTLVAPDNNPQAGDLRGGCELIIYESPPGQTVDLNEGSRDVRMRFFLDDQVHFDLELGLVESKGPVHLTASRVDFQGTGLTLIYNEKRNRINRLEIAQGKLLRYNSTPLEDEPLRAPRPPVPPTSSQTAPPVTTPAPADPREPDYYVAVFEELVAVRSSDAAIDADRMDLVFAMQSGGKSESPEKQLGRREWRSSTNSARTSVPPVAPHAGTPPAPTTLIAPAAQRWPILSPPTGRSLMPTRGNDINVTWVGRLLVQPIDDLPEDFTGANDSHVTLIGNVKVRSVRKETIAAQRVEYLSSSGRVKIWGTPEKPLMIDSAAMGRLTAQHVDINQTTGIGRIDGAGSIVGYETSVRIAGNDPAKAGNDAARKTREMTVQWSQHVELAFAVKKKEATVAPAPPAASDQPRSLDPSARLDELKEANFHGDVKVDHSQLAVEGDRLALTLMNTTKQKQQPALVKVTGHVKAKSRDTKPKDELAIDADDLEVTFTPDQEGKTQPSRMVANGNVKAAQPDREITAGLLDVALAQTPRKPAAAPVAPGTPQVPAVANAAEQTGMQLAVTKLHAMHDVKVRSENPKTLVDAHQLDADIASGLFQVFGPAEKPAKVQRESNSITGRQIVMNDKDQTIQVTGPGEADFITTGRSPLEQPANPEDAKAAAAAAVAAAKAAAGAKKPAKVEPQHMHITWLNSMDFNNLTGAGRFRGGVVATSDRGVDLSRLQADEVDVHFDPLDPKDKKSSLGAGISLTGDEAPKATVEAAKEQVGAERPQERKPRTVRKLVAREQVVFESEKWADRVGGKLATRFRLTGPLLDFDNISEQIIITGAGSMQIEDYRTAKKKDDNTKPGDVKPPEAKPTEASKQVAFVGEGVTLFIWQKQLTVDAKRNDVRMDGDVRMVQLPQGSDQDVRMDCNQLVADFKSTGGLDSWLNGKAGEPKLDNLTAAGPVILKHTGRTITGDQLYYTGNNALVVISSEGARLCELLEAESVLPAKRFKWYLDKDKWVAEEPGAVRQRAGDLKK